MTWKHGSVYSATASKSVPRRVSSRTRGPLQEAVERSKTMSIIDKLKARSLKLIRRSRCRHNKEQVRRWSHKVTAQQLGTVHFDTPATEEDERSDTEFGRLHPFRRSSKFRQPVRRISRAKGSPPPAQLARIHHLITVRPFTTDSAQANFDEKSDREGADEPDPLPPQKLRNNTAALACESSGGDLRHCSDERYAALPAISVSSSTAAAQSDEEKCGPKIASYPLQKRSNQLQEASGRTRIARSSMRRSSINGSVRRRASIRGQSVRRASARRPNLLNNRTRRCSAIAGTPQQKSSVIPGNAHRRRSVTAPYVANPLHYRKRRRKKRPYRRPRKIVVIGDMCSGKTNLISAYCRDRFSETYTPTILTSCMTDADVLGEKIELVVVEVAGRNDYTKLRHCAYHKMDLVILCYSADNPTTLNAIKTYWLPELKKSAPKVPYILVGTKKDIREEKSCEVKLPRHLQNSTTITDCGFSDYTNELQHNFVTTRQGLETAEKIGAIDFIECSALYRDGTRNVFETAAKIALKRSPRRKKR